MALNFEINKATRSHIVAHFHGCDFEFLSALTQKVDIDAYSTKLTRFAHQFEAWDNNQLVGLVAAYFDSDKHSSYITNVSVWKNNQDQGIGSQLLQQCITKLLYSGAKDIALDVAIGNVRAINFYRKHGFLPEGQNGSSLHMIYYGDKNEQQ